MDCVDSSSVRAQSSPSTAEEREGGAECRCVSRAWCRVINDAVRRGLPPMPTESLAALLLPGKLRSVLLSCRYVSHDHHHQTPIVYDSLVTKAEAFGIQLRNAVVLAGGVSPAATTRRPSPRVVSEGGPNGGTMIGEASATMCYRVALRRVVSRAFSSPVFSWCSTLRPEDSRLLEGCVGARCLLNARWRSVFSCAA